MNRSRLSEKVLRRSISGLHQAVLDALPEALFLIDSTTGDMRSLNSAAARWAPRHPPAAITWSVAHLLPELNLARLPEWTNGFHLSRAIEPATNTRREVLLHLYPLMDGLNQPVQSRHSNDPNTNDPETFADDAGLMVIGLRLFDSAVSREELTCRDAFHDAFHDPLTRLPNRRLFHRRLERIIERAGRSSHHFAVLFVDLDRFKSVNDRFGHTQGDKLLISAAHRLVEAVRPQDMVARRDGDEFTVLLDDLDQPQDAVGVAKRIVDHLQLPLPIEAAELKADTVTIGASIGIAVAADGMRTAEELISQADAAMYHAKALGGGVFLASDGLRTVPAAPPHPKKPQPR
jgi:diguanylate cyclase (GGDEF)-like protein